MVLVIIMLAVNFFISWSNASICGRYWSESKREGGGLRLYMICGYIQSIFGFTMVYAYTLLLIAPVFMQMKGMDQDSIYYFQDLAANLTYLVVVFPILSSGLVILIKGYIITWENRTASNIIVSGWNTYAMAHNTISAFREVPSALGKVVEAFFGGKRKKGKETLVLLAVFLVILALLGGYFTASTILKNADKEFDAYEHARSKAKKKLEGMTAEKAEKFINKQKEKKNLSAAEVDGLRRKIQKREVD